MDLKQQKELIILYNQYQEVDRDTIKANIKQYMDQVNIKPAQLSQLTAIPLQTIYQLRKFNVPYKPDFITVLIICNALKITITAVLAPLPGLPITEHKTKWTSNKKQQFIDDYNSLHITELCKKYSITERTAGEYNRLFNVDMEDNV
ncbi:helix-turn-helix transcriptional regulator [Clostridium sp.]|uniref:helix-turn-helix domain-containing protein n=1 Tax=Clostridium sp. TaxID=1506 RepID=UPI0025BAF5B9|nr:helix-turn-helix transcriptional regulator [Clostridium sp.]